MSLSQTVIDALLPDYRRRHVFAAKLRLVAYIGFWAIYLAFFFDVLGQTTAITGIVIAASALTAFGYFNIMRGRWLLPSFTLELICDLTAITAVLYLTGGPHSPYYTIYLFYVIFAGVLYSYALAAIVAAASAAFYGLFLLFCSWGAIPPLILDYGDQVPIPTYTPVAHFLFALVFLGGIVYTVKVASVFSQQRERALEKRNRELTALYRMTATVRSARRLEEVIDHLLSCIIEGLGLQAAALVYFEREKHEARLYIPRGTPHRDRIEQELGRPLADVVIPLPCIEGPAMQEIERHRLIFRRNLAELAEGVGDVALQEKLREVQRIIGAQRVIIVPVVVEEKLLGAIIGFNQDPFVEEEQVATMESFANQSALSLEAALLIDQLQTVNAELLEASRVKSEFLATMSHELRTPLTAIIGFSELLLEGVMGDLSDEQKESLGEVLHNAADLLEMINSLLDLTKVESGKMRLDLRLFDLHETIGRVGSTITPLVGRKEQVLSIDVPGDIPHLEGDERKIQQVLLNLLANANKFTPEKGRIAVSVRRYGSVREMKEEASLAPHLERVAPHFERGGIAITVADDGIGIPEDHLERVFDMFHQADSSATRSFGGTGLGLALARRFVEMHGGRIWVESALGEGAQFTFILPCQQTTI